MGCEDERESRRGIGGQGMVEKGGKRRRGADVGEIGFEAAAESERAEREGRVGEEE